MLLADGLLLYQLRVVLHEVWQPALLGRGTPTRYLLTPVLSIDIRSYVHLLIWGLIKLGVALFFDVFPT